MKIKYFLFGFMLLMTGCSMLNPTETKDISSNAVPEHLCMNASGTLVECDDIMTKEKLQQANSKTDQAQEPMQVALPIHSLEYSVNTVVLYEYVEQMAAKLMNSVSEPLNVSAVGVTSIVEFTPDTPTTNIIGNLLAELFITELHNNGISVVDYKVNNDVIRTNSGDFVFTRSDSQQSSAQYMDYILTGSLIYNKSGVLINIRIVNFHSKRVVSTTKKIVPYFVLDNLIPSQNKQTIIM